MSGNYLELKFKQFQNNKVEKEGFYSEFQSKDFDRYLKETQKTTGENTEGSDKLLYIREAKTLVLKPNIEPIDMFAVQDTIQAGRIVGDWWDIYDSLMTTNKNEKYLSFSGYASLSLVKSPGNPIRNLIFQKNIQYKNIINDYKGVRWTILAGRGFGYYGKEDLKENQGIVVWIGQNKLPEGEPSNFSIILEHLNPLNTNEWLNAIVITISKAKKEDEEEFTEQQPDRIEIGHIIDLKNRGTVPPTTDVMTQWQSFLLKSRGKSILTEWGSRKGEDFSLFTIMIIDRFILFGINGLDNPIVFECENFDIGKTIDGLEYPIILREGARLRIEGSGQAMIGFKKLAFEKEGTIRTPELFFPEEFSGKFLLNIKRNNEEEVEGKLYQKENKLKAEIKLKGEQVEPFKEPSTEAEKRYYKYLENVSFTTPLFQKVKIFSLEERGKEDITLPSDIEGDIISFEETANLNENDVIDDYSFNIEIAGDFDKTFEDVLGKKKLKAEIFAKFRGGDDEVSLENFIIKEADMSIKEFDNFELKLSGDNEAIHFLKEKAGYIISFDDRKITDIEAMKEICDALKLDFYTDIEGIVLPETPEGEEGLFTFQQNTTYLEILEKLASIQGYNLFTYSGTVLYVKDRDEKDLDFGRTEDCNADNITMSHLKTYKSRVVVIGKSRRPQKVFNPDTQEWEYYKVGEKMVGIWKSSSLEKEIGFIPYLKEDFSLSTWDNIIAEGEKLWRRFNKQVWEISFDIEGIENIWKDIRLGNVFIWTDELYPSLNGKMFKIVGYSKTISGSKTEAHIKGRIING